MAALQRLAKEIGTDQDLSRQLWNSGWYEARLLATLIGDPDRVTSKQMNDWASSFENWADCDTACFKLFDKVEGAYQRATQWAKSPREFVKRGGFALMASLALHDKEAPDSKFLSFFPLIEKGASDGRNFVKKGVSWALRSIGRRSPELNKPSVDLAKRLVASSEPATRWVGKDALKELASPKVQAQLSRRSRGPTRAAGKPKANSRSSGKAPSRSRSSNAGSGSKRSKKT